MRGRAWATWASAIGAAASTGLAIVVNYATRDRPGGWLGWVAAHAWWVAIGLALVCVVCGWWTARSSAGSSVSQTVTAGEGATITQAGRDVIIGQETLSEGQGSHDA